MIENHSIYLESAHKGKTYIEIKKQAIADGIKQEELRRLMREVDDIILKKEKEEAAKSQAREMIYVGTSFFLLSACTLLYLYIDSGSHYIYLASAGMAGGIMIISKGRSQLKHKKND